MCVLPCARGMMSLHNCIVDQRNAPDSSCFKRFLASIAFFDLLLLNLVLFAVSLPFAFLFLPLWACQCFVWPPAEANCSNMGILCLVFLAGMIASFLAIFQCGSAQMEREEIVGGRDAGEEIVRKPLDNRHLIVEPVSSPRVPPPTSEVSIWGAAEVRTARKTQPAERGLGMGLGLHG